MSSVGRVARLSHWIDRPELNGLYVVVINSTESEYQVQLLNAPNDPKEVQVLSTSKEKLDFLHQNTFASRFANPVVALITNHSIDKDGTILDLSNGYSFGILGISGSALVRGKSCPFSNVGSLNPPTVITFKVCACNQQSTKIVEFEDIHFSGQFSPDHGHYLRGNITFRRCRFTGTIAFQNNTRAVFESCLFETEMAHTKFHASIVLKECSIMYYNCVFRNVESAVSISDNSVVDMIHCHIENVGMSGVWTVGDRVQLHMTNCCVKNSAESGVYFAGSKCTVHLDGCRFEQCKDFGVELAGTKLTTLHLSNSVISGSNVGVNVREGKVDVTVCDTKISQCVLTCVNVSTTVMGRVVCTDCELEARSRNPIAVCMNLSSDLCEVVINGVPQLETEGFTKIAKAFVTSDAKLRIENVTLHHMRAMKKITSDSSCVQCANCRASEPDGVKFKACGKCKDVCYCSRVCQLAHWQQHKNSC